MHPGTLPPAPVITDQPGAVTGATTGTSRSPALQAGVNFQCISTASLAVPAVHSAARWPTARTRSPSRPATRPAASSAGTSYTWTTDTTSPPPPAFTRRTPNKLVTIVFENESHPSISAAPASVREQADRKRRRLLPTVSAVADIGTAFLELPGDDQRQHGGDGAPQHLRRSTPRAAPDVEGIHGVDAEQLRQGQLRQRPRHHRHVYTADHDPALNFSPNVSCATNDVPLDSSSIPQTCPLATSSPTSATTCTRCRPSGQACPAYYGSNTSTRVM